MALNIEKRTVSSARAPDLDSDRLAVQELEPLLKLGDDQGWFKERRSLIHILYDEITSLETDRRARTSGTLSRIAVCRKHRSSCNANSSAW
jgi:hypothetical protein